LIIVVMIAMSSSASFSWAACDRFQFSKFQLSALFLRPLGSRLDIGQSGGSIFKAEIGKAESRNPNQKAKKLTR